MKLLKILSIVMLSASVVKAGDDQALAASKKRESDFKRYREFCDWCESGQVEMVKKALSEGTRPGYATEVYSARSCMPGDCRSPLIAAIKGKSEKVVALLLANKANPNESLENNIPLYLALHKAGLPILKMLLEAGADPEERYQGDTALAYALTRGTADLEVLDLLLSKNADIGASIQCSQVKMIDGLAARKKFLETHRARHTVYGMLSCPLYPVAMHEGAISQEKRDWVKKVCKDRFDLLMEILPFSADLVKITARLAGLLPEKATR
jgi:hypothetical protein